MVDGFSSANPELARGAQVSADTYSKIYNNKSSKRRALPPTVSINGGIVKINGAGYSVAPSLQAAFIKQKTGGVGSSAQAAILTANKIEAERKRLEVAKQNELRKLEEIRKQVLASQISDSEKAKYYKQIQDAKKSVIFQNRLKSGEIQGFSGIGLFPSEYEKRKFLLKTGKFTETSSKDNIFTNLDPLTNTFFINRNITTKEKVNFINFLKSKQFKIAKDDIKATTLNRGRYLVNNIKKNIAAIRADPSKLNLLSAQINKDKNYLIETLKSHFASRINFTNRTATLLAMSLLASGINILTVGGELIKDYKGTSKKAVEIAKEIGAFSKNTIEKTPSFVKAVYDNPKLYAKKGWTVSENLYNAAKTQSTVFAKLLATEPDYAVALIGKEIVILYASGGLFKIVGSVKGATKVKLLSSFKKVSEVSKIRLLKIPAIRKLDVKIKIAKANIEYKKALDIAKKSRINAGKKGKTLIMTSPDYKKSLTMIENLTDATAKVKTLKYVNNLILKGGKISPSQYKQLIKKIKDNYRTLLRNSEEYKELLRLSKLDRFQSVKLIKQSKIKSARILFNQYALRLSKSKFGTNISISYKNIKNAANRPVKKLKATGKKEIKKFKTKLEVASNKIRAKKNRIAAGKKGKTIIIGNYEYAKAVDFVESFADNYAKVRAKTLIKLFKKSGKKFGIGEEARFLENTQIFVRKELNKITDFKKLKKAAKLNEPFAIKLVKTKKLETAKRFFNKLKKDVLSIKVLKKIKTFSRIVKTKTSPKRIEKVIKRKIDVRKQQKFIRKTIKYRLYKARPIREVTLNQLIKSARISNINNVIDSFFNQMAKKHQISVSQIKFNQLKNIIKKRVRKAIKSGDKKELDNFKIAFQKLMRDMKKTSSNPNVKVVEKIGKIKRIRTIKDFDIPKPKGTYIEVKVGDQVLLQKVEAKVKDRVKKKTVQKLKIVQVQKKKLNIKPLLEFGIKSVSVYAFRNILNTKQQFGKISNQSQFLRILKDSKQDIKVIQDVASVITPKSNVASVITSKIKSLQKANLKTIQRKKIIAAPKIPKKFITKKLSKSQQTYHVITKKRGKLVRLYPSSLTIGGARDYLAYSIDNNLTKSAWLVPSSKSKNVRSPPKNIQGYYSKVSKKLRPYKIRYGRKKLLLNGYIEKRKYFQDTKGEKLQVKRLKAKKKKKLTPMQRRVLLARMKKVRAAINKKRK